MLILAAFEPLRHNDFIDFDDDDYVTENHHVQTGITGESVAWAFTSSHALNWHPLTWLSHMLDIELFGLNPLGHHLHNLVLHISATVLLFIVLHKMTGAVWCSAFAAIAFGIHPLRVESVAWVSERKDVLSTLFWMLTIAAYLYYAKRGSLLRYLLVLLCFGLGLMAKPMLVTLPMILLILDFWPLHRLRLRGMDQAKKNDAVAENYRPASIARLTVEKIPLFILALASCIITYQVQQSGGVMTELEFLSWTSRISNALFSYVGYLGKIAWPANLAILYPYPHLIHRPSAQQPVIIFLILIFWSVFVIYRYSKQPYLTAGWFWYVITLIPVIGLVQVGAQSMADRYTYLPSIGIFIMLSWTAAKLTQKWRYQKILMGIISGLVITAMLMVTRTQLTCWKNSSVLYEHTLAVTKDNYIIHNSMGTIFLKQNKFDEAADHFKEALQIYPDYYEAYINMAIALKHRNLLDQAISHLRIARKIKPNDATVYLIMGSIFVIQQKSDEAIYAYEQAVRFDTSNFTALNQLGALKGDKGLFDEATECFRQSIQVNPDYAKAYRNLAILQQRQGQIDESIRNFRAAVQAEPDEASWWYLAISLHDAGRLHEAADAYHQLLRLNPNSIKALNNLAWMLSTNPDSKIEKPDEVILLAQKACELTHYQNPSLLDTLSVAYAAAGQFKEAIEISQKAIDLAATAGQTDIAEEISKHLQLYRNGKPYHEVLEQK